LVLASELAGPAELTELRMLCASSVYDSGVFSNYRMLACPVSRTELATTYGQNYEGRVPDTVAGADRLEVFWTNGEWGSLPFDRALAYNGSDNLLLEFRWNGDDGRAVYTRGWYPPGGNRTLDGYSLTAPEGELRPYMVCLRLYYTPAAVGEQADPAPARVRVVPSATRATPVRILGLGAGDRVAVLAAGGRVVARPDNGFWYPAGCAAGVYFVRVLSGESYAVRSVLVVR
jgi:hypothetical protein